MNYFFTALMLATIGCGGSSSNSTTNNNHDDQGVSQRTDGSNSVFDQSVTTCSRNCGCNADLGSVCIGSSETSPYAATCLPLCDVNVPCASGRCVFLINEPTATVPVCIPTNFADNCAGATAQVCDTIVAHCIDAAVLIKPYQSADGRVCGSEVQICATSCVAESSTNADGGIVDGGIAAHCE